MNILTIAIIAWLGGIVASLLGWLERDPDNFKIAKFAPSILRALLAGAAFAAGYEAADLEIGMSDLLIAFVGGAGVDVMLNRGAGVVSRGKK